ncbi:MAG: hypothetical protein EPN61_01800 [Burkholderiaceae bacterium]|nr:MAG: hypothetical protein EPN61_01800 [Burkholderiaceae bacterium]
MLVAALNASMERQVPLDVGERLLHKRFRIDVRDARATFDFTWSTSGLARACRTATSAEEMALEIRTTERE